MTNNDLAGIVAVPCYETLSRGLFVGFDRCEQEGHPLNQLQKIALVTSAVQCADGLAAEIRSTFAFDGLMAQWAQQTQEEEAPE